MHYDLDSIFYCLINPTPALLTSLVASWELDRHIHMHKKNKLFFFHFCIGPTKGTMVWRHWTSSNEGQRPLRQSSCSRVLKRRELHRERTLKCRDSPLEYSPRHWQCTYKETTRHWDRTSINIGRDNLMILLAGNSIYSHQTNHKSY